MLATLRNRLRSGDVWVERSSNYRRFDSYLLPVPAVTPIAVELDLPATADEWLETRGRELDRRLKRFAQRLKRGQLEGVEMRDERLHVAALKAVAPAEAEALADRLDAMMPRVRITELLHEVNRATGFAAAFTNIRTGEACDNENAHGRGQPGRDQGPAGLDRRRLYSIGPLFSPAWQRRRSSGLSSQSSMKPRSTS